MSVSADEAIAVLRAVYEQELLDDAAGGGTRCSNDTLAVALGISTEEVAERLAACLKWDYVLGVPTIGGAVPYMVGIRLRANGRAAIGLSPPYPPDGLFPDS